MKFLISYASNATPIHKPFFEAAKAFCKVEKAQFLVIPGRYRNPTSRWSKQQETDDWWAEELKPYLLNKRKNLSPRLKVFGDVSIQPTADNPLRGFEVFVGKSSAIFGHPQRALEVVATGSRTPRLLLTTSACTVPNYTPSKAGMKGKAHHVIGGLVVEVNEDGTYFCRHVTWDARTKSFTDLNKRYTAEGVQEAPPAAGLVLGDWHAGTVESDVYAATERLVELLRPQNLILHDVLDFRTRNHHDTSTKSKYGKLYRTVEAEVGVAADDLKTMALWAPYVRVVRSNHDEAFERWLEECDPDLDLTNAHYYHKMWDRSFEHYIQGGRWPNLFEIESRRLGVPSNVKFLKRDERLRIMDIDCGFHGDKGLNGAKPSRSTYVNLGHKTIVGHNHTPFERKGASGVGVTGSLKQGYNKLPGTWMHANVSINADGKRQTIFILDGKFKGETA